MQAEPTLPPPANEDRESWWATEEYKAAWIEFVEVNKVRTSLHNTPEDLRLTHESFQT